MKKLINYILKLWEKTRLFFARTYIFTDFGSDDKTVTTFFKKVGDKIYVVDEKVEDLKTKSSPEK